MPDPGQFALFVAAALLLAVTPGPGIFYVAARAPRRWSRRGHRLQLRHRPGRHGPRPGGQPGRLRLVLASAELFTALKLIGAAYLVWLGLRTIVAARRDALAAADGWPRRRPSARGARSAKACWWRR